MSQASEVRLATVWRRLRGLAPRVHCITNRISAQRVSDFVLASGGSPKLADNPREIPEFARLASSLYFNTGLHTTQIDAIDAVIAYRQDSSEVQPILVIDPEAIGVTSFRTDQIEHLIELSCPDVIKGNSREIAWLATRNNNIPTGDPNLAESEKADLSTKHATVVAARYGCVVAVTGSMDVVVNASGERVARICGDCKQLQRITGLGSAVGAVCAATAAACGGDYFIGTVTALAAIKYAAREATKISQGPGTLAVHTLDQLFRLSLTPENLRDNLVAFNEEGEGGIPPPPDATVVDEEKMSLGWSSLMQDEVVGAASGGGGGGVEEDQSDKPRGWSHAHVIRSDGPERK